MKDKLSTAFVDYIKTHNMYCISTCLDDGTGLQQCVHNDNPSSLGPKN